MSGQGTVAVVLYDYEATEDNEMHLIEGEYIEQIEEVGEGWWSGVGADGKTGLFPGSLKTFVFKANLVLTIFLKPTT